MPAQGTSADDIDTASDTGLIDARAELYADFVTLGELLLDASPSDAAALVRERRMILQELEQLSDPSQKTFFDELDERRQRTNAASVPSRRRYTRPG